MTIIEKRYESEFWKDKKFLYNALFYQIIYSYMTFTRNSLKMCDDWEGHEIINPLATDMGNIKGVFLVSRVIYMFLESLRLLECH